MEVAEGSVVATRRVEITAGEVVVRLGGRVRSDRDVLSLHSGPRRWLQDGRQSLREQERELVASRAQLEALERRCLDRAALEAGRDAACAE